jgi:hypothetical protein
MMMLNPSRLKIVIAQLAEDLFPYTLDGPTIVC